MVAPFHSPRLVRHPWAQTLLAQILPDGVPSPSERGESVELPDGDRLHLAITAPSPTDAAYLPTKYPARSGTVILVHGLCGSQESPYMRRLASRLSMAHQTVVRVNLRGCGPGMGHARNPYHSGQFEDIAAVVRHLHARIPGISTGPICVIGFSLGANIVLRLAARQPRFSVSDAAGTIDSFVAICPPLDLAASARKIDSRANRWPRTRFLQLLAAHARSVYRHFPDTPEPVLCGESLIRFDDDYTAPRSGFADAMDYYARASSGPGLAAIKRPTLIVSADDDPLIAMDTHDRFPSSTAVTIERSSRGGHVGFVGASRPGVGRWWLDERICAWLAEREKAYAKLQARADPRPDEIEGGG